MKDTDISSLTLNRLSVYLRCLRSLRQEGQERVSSLELAERYHLSAAQIRKDLAQLGEFGIRGVGYDVDQLAENLSRLLGLDRTHLILIVGAGNLGSALARFLSFDDRSFRVVAAIDNDPAKVGQMIGDVRIFAPEDLNTVVKKTRAEIAVLAVPMEPAQSIYDRLVESGIRAVLNFAPVRLDRKAGVPTKAVDLRIFLEGLGYQMEAQVAPGESDPAA